MRKSKVGPWIVAGALLVSAGLAFAEEAPGPTIEHPAELTSTVEVEIPEEPEVKVETEAKVAEVAEVAEVVEVAQVVEVAEPGALTDTIGVDDEEPLVESEHPDNHGAVVSRAAHNHDHDEACGNHGAYVSHVARTGEEPPCATGGDVTTARDGKAKGKSKR